jgi:hypothetical protein
LPLNSLSDERVSRLRQLLKDHPGPSQVFLHVGSKVIRLAEDFTVDARSGLLGELRVLFGPGCLWNTPAETA